MRFKSICISTLLAFLFSGSSLTGRSEEPRSTSPDEKSTVKTLNLLTTMPGPEFGTLRIDSSPEGAEVSIDGYRTGYKTPLVLRGVRKGKEHSLSMSLQGYLPWSGSILMDEGLKSMSANLKQK